MEVSPVAEQESEDTSSPKGQQSPTSQLYDESELRVSNRTISVDPTPAAGADDGDSIDTNGPEKEVVETPSNARDVLNETASNEGARDQSVYDVEDLGMALAEAYEATRLQRDFGCETPESYVFRVDERHLVEAARHGNGETALQILEEQAGIPEHFPGFDLLTVNPDTLEPDRLIELKASTVRRRKPSVSWNEWTTARNEWIQNRESPLYYLYVIGHLSKTTSSEPYIRTIANPYRLLDAQVENDVSVTQSIQVDIDGFTEEELESVSDTDPVIEIPVDTTDDGTT